MENVRREKSERDSKRIFTGRRDFRKGGLNSVTANEEDGELKSKGTAWARGKHKNCELTIESRE